MKIIFIFALFCFNIFSQDSTLNPLQPDSIIVEEPDTLKAVDPLKPEKKDSALVILEDKNAGELIIDDAVILAEDAASFFTAPLRFSGTDWLIAAGVAGGTIGLIYLDEKAQNAFTRKDAGTLNKDFWDIPTSFGIIGYANIFSFGVYAGGLISGERSVRVTGRLLVESLFLSGITVMGVRFIAGRVRPYYNEGAYRFKGLQPSNEFQSFPSGHTTVAFAISTVLAERFDNTFARIGFYGISTLTAFARVYNNQHWVSDVVVGALLGFGAGRYVVHKEREREAGEETFLSIFPTLNGVSITYRF